MSEQYQAITEQLNRIEQLTLLAAKEAFTIIEVCLFTGLTKNTIHRMTSEKKIPHYKRGKTLYFKKNEIENWMLSNKRLTIDEIDNAAATYVTINKKN